MTGFILFRNAVLRVMRNLNEALAVSGLIWIGILIIQILMLGGGAQAVGPDGAVVLSSEESVMILLNNVVMTLGACWIAVEWHRFILEGKRPTSAFPSWSGNRVWRYLFLMIGINLLVGLLVGIPAGFFVALFGNLLLSPLGGFVLLLLIVLPTIYLMLRVSPALSAVALGERLPLREAWNATRPHAGVIFQAGILTILSFMALMAFAPIFGNGLIGLLYILVAGWVLLMINISLLSSIYELSMKGHFDA